GKLITAAPGRPEIIPMQMNNATLLCTRGTASVNPAAISRHAATIREPPLGRRAAIWPPTGIPRMVTPQHYAHLRSRPARRITLFGEQGGSEPKKRGECRIGNPSDCSGDANRDGGGMRRKVTLACFPILAWPIAINTPSMFFLSNRARIDV